MIDRPTRPQASLRTHKLREVQRPRLHRRLIAPTLRVVTPPVTLRVTWLRDAERPGLHSHAERGNDQP
ncbi:hypothetical protein FIV37_19315 [Pseudomonas gessardii]|nr:hypothetical protein [Pseudomonas gessardii]